MRVINLFSCYGNLAKISHFNNMSGKKIKGQNKSGDNLSEALGNLSLKNDRRMSNILAMGEKEGICAQDVILLMHGYWRDNLKTRDELRNAQQKLLWSKASSVLNEVTAYKEGDESATVFNKMVCLCVLLSGLGSPSCQAVAKETYPALRSVLKLSDLAGFAELPQIERQEHILELAQIVMGIRLFNKDCLKGGAGIDDLPESLPKAVDASFQRLNQLTELLENRCNSLTTALLKIYELTEIENIYLEPLLPVGRSRAESENLKVMLCLVYQHLHFLRDLSKQIMSTKTHVQVVIEQLQSTLIQLHETVRFRSAIPTIQVYPLFVQLSVVWRELQQESAVLSHVNELLETVQTVVEEMRESSLEQFVLKDKAVAKSYSKSFQPEDSADIKIRGFCPWSLVQTDGGLIQGTFKSSGFLFRSPEAAMIWERHPESSSNFRTVLQTQLHLRLLLGVSGLDEGDGPELVFREDVSPKRPYRDAEVQTELHPVPHHIDPNYAWNEWELKRQAIRLARITNTVTRSQQTLLSQFRASKETQSRKIYERK